MSNGLKMSAGPGMSHTGRTGRAILPYPFPALGFWRLSCRCCHHLGGLPCPAGRHSL